VWDFTILGKVNAGGMSSVWDIGHDCGNMT